MKRLEDSPSAPVVMPVQELHGRTVWTESGEHVGVIRDVHLEDDGSVAGFEVRERWMLGPHRDVSAAGMRLDGGDVIVPLEAVGPGSDERLRDDDRVAERRRISHYAHAPVLLAGREGARGRFGGLDLVGSLFGALVTIACLVLFGGIVAAIFGAEPALIDTGLDNLEAITSESMLVAAGTIFAACFVGGWAAGRSARFDGAANGVLTVVWVLAIGLVLGGVGAWLGDEYDVFASSDLPQVATDEFAVWGSVAFLAALVLMLLGSALGGALGESWHRRADRAMLDVVSVDDSARQPTDIVGSSVDAQRVDDGDALPVDRSDRQPR